MDLTEAEKHYDAIVAERRKTGRVTYGRGLTHTDDYDWNRMAMEEALDLSQYLAAENLRLRAEIRRLRGEPVPDAKYHSSVPADGTVELNGVTHALTLT